LETRNTVLDEAYAEANAEVRPGPYVMLAVSDTGSGMPAAVRDKAFEPFFTTKGVGHGSGLGLSMVYGFVKQSGGHIKIYSEEGHGTTIRLYLPPAQGSVETAVSVAAPISGGTETILVVEDDALVRTFVISLLHSLGYQTVTATDSRTALTLVRGGQPFDLLFTDVVLPGGISGRQLADEVAKLRPGTKVLYTSGYTDNAIVHHGRLDEGVLLLSKPYRKPQLAQMVRRAISGTDALSA
jgi:CheY-like chemotaxis protein